MAYNVICCSGGKDSNATVELAKIHNIPVDEIIFSEVMFDNETSGELPEHIDFVKNVLKPRYEKFGYKFTIIHAENTYMDLFCRQVTRSKTESRNGKYRGFPLPLGCHVNSGIKIKAIKKYLEKIGSDRIEYIGIALDETERLQRIKGNQRSLLAEFGYMENMAFQLCEERNVLSPIYEFSNRGGLLVLPEPIRK